MKNIVFVLSVLCICGFGGVKFYLPKFVDSRVRNQINDASIAIQKQYDQLIETVKNLEARQQKLENLPSERKIVSNFKIDFEGWNCWCDLKNKLRCGDEYSEELAKFNKAFSDCPDLLKMVNSIIADENNEAKDNSLTNNLLRFAKIHGINDNELDRITGYVLLLSIRKVEENE